MKKIKFNISPSAMNCYYESPITFYYTYIAKEKPDSISYQIYGKMGSLIHDLLEHLPKKFDDADKLNTISKFNMIFDKENYIKYKTLNGKPIDKYKYLEALKNGFKILKNKYDLVKAEECILFPFVNNTYAEINLKGIIDVQAKLKETGQYIIVDYKTSSSVSSGLDFKRQGLFYCWAVWKKYNILPKKTIFEYIKIDKVKEYEFSENDLITFEKELLDFGNMILEKGFDINKYEIGHYKTPFNVYKQQISKEELRRENEKVKNTKYIDLFLEKHKLYFNRNENTLPEGIKKILDNKLSYYINGHEFSPKFQAKLWDGKKHILRKRYLPFGLFNILNKFISDYNNHFKTHYVLRIIDLRNKNIMNQKFNTKFKNRKVKLRYYQKDAVNEVLNNKYNDIITPGIINAATGCLSGESYIDVPRKYSDNPKGIKIKDLVNKKNFPIYSYNRDTNCVELDNCKDVWFSGKKQTYKIKVKNGKEIIATKDHKFLVSIFDNNQSVYVTKYFKLEEIIKILKTVEEKKIKTKGKIKLICQHRNKKGNMLRYDFENKIRLEEQFIIGKKLFPNKGKKIIHHKDGNHYNNEISNLQVLNESEHLSIHVIKNKWHGKKLWEKTGHPKGMKNKEHTEESKLAISTNTSKALLGFDYISKTDKTKKKYELGDKSYVNDEFKQKVSVNSSKAIQEMLKDETKLKEWKNKSSLGAKTKYVSEIISIKKHDIIDTYDLEVENNHNYFANEICVHNSGKTIITTELIRQTNSRTLFIVNRNELAEQTKNVFQNILYNEENNIGLILEGQQNLDKQITVAGIQSIAAILKRDDTSSLQLQRFLLSINMVVWDEAQNVKNEGYYELMMKYLINTKYFVSLTGTAYRNDEHSLLMYSLVGTPIYTKTAKELEKEGFLCPVEINFFKYKQPKIDWDMSSDNFVDKYNNYIIHNENRNGLISNICSYNRNKKILILTNRVKHTKVIKELLDICEIDSRIITGITSKKNRKKWFDEFKNSTKEKPLVLIGSMKIFNAGIDIPDLDIIINAGAGKSETDVIQSIGRVLRKHNGKEKGYYYDFVDNISPFKEQSKLRIEYLENENHKVNIINNKFYK